MTNQDSIPVQLTQLENDVKTFITTLIQSTSIPECHDQAETMRARSIQLILKSQSSIDQDYTYHDHTQTYTRCLKINNQLQKLKKFFEFPYTRFPKAKQQKDLQEFLKSFST